MRNGILRYVHSIQLALARSRNLRTPDVSSITLPFLVCGAIGLIAMFLADGGGPLFAIGLLIILIGACLGLLRLTRGLIGLWIKA